MRKTCKPRPKITRDYISSMLKKLSDQNQVATSMLDKAVKSNPFEISSVCFFVNTLAICGQIHYQGLTLGYELNVAGYWRSGADIWPNGENLFKMLNLTFSALFTVEWVLQGIVLKLDFA